MPQRPHLGRCSIQGCEKTAWARNLCLMHYQQWRAKQDRGPCSVAGCDGKAWIRGMCDMHYQRVRAHGDPTVNNLAKPRANHCGARFCPAGTRLSDLARYQRDRPKRIARSVAWARGNPEKRRKNVRKWDSANRDKTAAKYARYRAKQKSATPPWMTKDDWKAIEALYRRARQLTKSTGIEHHVDHAVPLAGRDVCGLHVIGNLQILSGDDNRRKGNRLTPAPEARA